MGDDGGDGRGPVSKSGCEDGKRGDGESHAWGFNWGKGKGEEGCSLEQQLLGGGAGSQVLPPPAAWQELLSMSKVLVVGCCSTACEHQLGLMLRLSF